jgi:hypothetical protein
MNNDFLPDNRDYITIGIRFGAKDEDLRAWVESIPKGRFSLIVKDSITAHINNDPEYKLPCWDIKPSKKKSIQKSVYIGKMDEEVYDFINSIESFLRSNEIKKILRKYAGDLLADKSRKVSFFTPRQHSESGIKKEKADIPDKRKNEMNPPAVKTLPESSPVSDKEEAYYAKNLLRMAKMYNAADRLEN